MHQLVIVSGPEATGKTFIAKEIAKALGYEYQSKDSIEEAMFDRATHSTWNYGWYENTAKEEFFHKIGQCIKNNTNVVVESNFIGTDSRRLQALIINSDINVYEVYCFAKGMTTFKRFVSRNESGKRHKGHHDRRWYPKVLAEDLLQYVGIRWPSKPSGISENLIEVNTSEISKVNIQKIIEGIDIDL